MAVAPSTYQVTDTAIGGKPPPTFWFVVCLGDILLIVVITTLAVASLMAQFSGNVPEDSRLHVIDLVQAVHAAPVGAG